MDELQAEIQAAYDALDPARQKQLAEFAAWLVAQQQDT